MDQIEIRIHKEINDYHEKFYWFTFRQWVAVILFGITAVPFYLKFREVLGEDPISYIMIIYAVPFAFVGFIPVQKMPAEKMVKYIFRKETVFFKELPFKTEKEILLEKEYMKKLKLPIRIKKSLSKKASLQIQENCKEYVKNNIGQTAFESDKKSGDIIKEQPVKKTRVTRKERKKIKKQKKLEKFKEKALKKGWISDVQNDTAGNFSDQQIEQMMIEYLKKKDAEKNEQN
ncbi:MAG: PrgI family protein [Thomasclavelia ramosa]